MPWSPNSYLVGVPSQMETAVLPSVPWQGPCHGSFTPGLVKAGFLERVRGTGLVGGGGGPGPGWHAPVGSQELVGRRAELEEPQALEAGCWRGQQLCPCLLRSAHRFFHNFP